MVSALTAWYSEFAKRHAPFDAVYSPARKAFAARRGAAVPYEHWTDLAELESLCRLVGPYGAKQLDRELLKIIAGRIKAIREALSTNKGALSALAKNFYHGPAVADAVKRMSGLDSAVNEVHFLFLLFCSNKCNYICMIVVDSFGSGIATATFAARGAGFGARSTRAVHQTHVSNGSVVVRAKLRSRRRIHWHWCVGCWCWFVIIIIILKFKIIQFSFII